MADRKLINPAIVKDIADAIREKGGTTEQIRVADLGDAVRALPSGGLGEDVSSLLDAVGVESREDTGVANGLAITLTDEPLPSEWSGVRPVANGAGIKDGIAFVARLKGKTASTQRLPSSYQEVEYLTSDYVGGVPTGIVPSAGSKVEFVVEWMSTESGYIGANLSLNEGGGGAKIRICGVTSIDKVVGARNKLTIWATSGNRMFQIDDTTSGSGSAISQNNEFYIFGMGGNYKYPHKLIGDFKMWQDEVLVRDYVPCYRKSDSVAGYYDLVNSTFNTISNSKPLTAGDDIPVVLISSKPSAIVARDGSSVEVGRLDIALPSIFPDGLASVGDIYDEIDYLHNVAIKRVGVVDMGTLGWSTYGAGGDHVRYRAALDGAKTAGGSAKANIVCSTYMTDTYNNVYNHIADKTIAMATEGLVVYDSAYSSRDAFKAAMSGVYLFYELAEEQTEPIDAKAWYKVASGGSEEAVCGNGVPLVAEIASRMDYTEAINDYELAKTLI